MNKETILAKLADFPYGMDGFWLVAGAALVLFGVRSETADIDMGCTTKAADRLEADGYPCEITEDGCRRFRIGGDLEIFENWLCGSVEIVDGIPTASLRGVREMKRRLGREKDLRDIRLIDAFPARREDLRDPAGGDAS